MALANVFGHGSNPTGLVDRVIGDAFPIVRHVSNNIAYVKHVSAHLPELYTLWELRDTISLLVPSAETLIPIYNNLAQIIYVNDNLPTLLDLYPDVSALLALNVDKQELLDAEIYIRSFEARFGDADGAFAQATQTAINAANTAVGAKNLAVPAAEAAQAAEENIDAFLMATTTEQARMAAFIVEINNRTLV